MCLAGFGVRSQPFVDDFEDLAGVDLLGLRFGVRCHRSEFGQLVGGLLEAGDDLFGAFFKGVIVHFSAAMHLQLDEL